MHGTADRRWTTTDAIVSTSPKHEQCEYQGPTNYIPHIASCPHVRQRNTQRTLPKNSSDAWKPCQEQQENACLPPSASPSENLAHRCPTTSLSTMQPHYHGHAQRVNQHRKRHPRTRLHRNSHVLCRESICVLHETTWRPTARSAPQRSPPQHRQHN